MSKGKIYLIGAGPGDPGLISVKGVEILNIADVVVYDRLSSNFFLQKVKQGCELIPRADLSQNQVNEILVKRANQGKLVVRLKGGDPFLFGRGAEEAFYLKKRRAEFEIIPGISSAIAVPEVAGIPLTHRDCSSSLTIVTGHDAPCKGAGAVNWGKIAKSADTIVILMGVNMLSRIGGELIKGGKGERTPVAIIHRGTTSSQRSIITTLGNIVQTAKQEKIIPPCVVVVGEIVKLGKKLEPVLSESFKPLSNRKILITTPQNKLRTLLQLEGAKVLHLPTISLKPLKDNYLLQKIIKNISIYHWIVFTSQAAVDFFWNELEAKAKDSRHVEGIKLAAIGPATAARLNTKGILPDIVPGSYSTRGLLKKFDGLNIKGKRFILPRSSRADSFLSEELQKKGAEVTELKLYTNQLPFVSQDKANKVKEQILRGEVDLTVFTSASTLFNFIKIFGEKCLAHTKLAAIGPVTARAAEENGVNVDITAHPHTFEGLVQAIKEYCI